METRWFGKQKILNIAFLLSACGGGGKGDSGVTAAVLAPPPLAVVVTGSIKSVSGSQSEMRDWVVAMINYDKLVSSVGVINAAGNFSLPNVLNSERYTLILLDPQYKLAAVLTAPSDSSKTVKQVFKLTGTQLPILVHNGPIINFTNLSGISLESVTAADTDGDLIPNGKEAALRSVNDNADDDVDTDGDKVPNASDPDIDGDGLLNVVDLDDDGDGTPDTFDTDANGDDILDTMQTVGDLYFPTLLAYGGVQVVQDTLADGGFATSLIITTKISGAKPSSLKIRGANSLFENSNAVRVNEETGDLISVPFDFVLLDDGQNEDGAPGDGTYVRRVQLAPGKLPKAQQLVFFQYSDAGGIDGATRLSEFPFMFPDVVSGAIGGNFAADTRTVTLTGAPFASLTSFRWTVDIYESSGEKVFVSEPIDGTEITYVIPLGVLDPASTYTARIVATSPERLPSYPSWIVRTANFNL